MALVASQIVMLFLSATPFCWGLYGLVEKLGNGKNSARVLKTSAQQKSAKKSAKIDKTLQTLKNT
jgi:hypothetical protein